MSVEKKVSQEELSKAIDTMIDEFFSEEAAEAKAETSEPAKEETVAKAKDAISEIIGDPKQASMEKDPNRNPATTADDSGNNPEKAEEDEKAGKKRGRPNDMSQMSMRDMSTGESKGSYDDSISEPSSDGSKSEDSQVKQPDWLQSKGSDKSANDSGKGPQSGASQASSDQPSLSEFSQVKLPAHLSKADGEAKEETVAISKAEYEELKKARDEKEAAKKEEELKKAKEEQADLIKSAVLAATEDLRKSNEELKKELEETKKLAKSVAEKPRARKSISSISVLEKGGFDESGNAGRPQYFTKSQMLDAAVELASKQEISDNEVIEFEMTGSISNPASREKIENFLRKK